MRKILISARDLKIGGIEKVLIELIKYLVEHRYKVTLILEEKKGELLKQINQSLEIIEYNPCSTFFVPLRKTINIIKRVKFIIKNKNKYDVSISFATYSKSGSFVARTASKRSILWCHADYLQLFDGNKKNAKKFFSGIKFKRFAKIVFVSKSGKRTFNEIFPNQNNVYFCNNLINSTDINQKAKEKIDINDNPNVTTFLNVGRHDEKQKKLSRIINAAVLLKNDGLNFRILFVGSGQDTEEYKKLVNKYNLQNNIFFIGAKENPYPYFKISDFIILSSDYEGYPVVFLESYILNKPIITTNVSDYEEIQDKRGIVVKKDHYEIYKAMRFCINNGYEIKDKFNAKSYNLHTRERLNRILNEWK